MGKHRPKHFSARVVAKCISCFSGYIVSLVILLCNLITDCWSLDHVWQLCVPYCISFS